MRNSGAKKAQSLKSAFKSVTPPKTRFLFSISALCYGIGKIAGQQCLDISKIEAGEVNIDEEDVDLPVLVEAAITMLRAQAKSQDITLSRIFPSDCPKLHADPRHIKQIVLNLVSNAVKFTPPKGTIKVEVLVDRLKTVSIIIEDTGIGIKPENIDKVLEPFGQVGNIYSRNHEGTGLGLPLAKSLVELHGGILEISSELGKGTRVSAHFPPERTVAANITTDAVASR